MHPAHPPCRIALPSVEYPRTSLLTFPLSKLDQQAVKRLHLINRQSLGISGWGKSFIKKKKKKDTQKLGPQNSSEG